MGNCVSSKTKVNQVSIKFTNLQVKLITLMYKDLAERCKQCSLNRQTFDIFFHLNGLWGHQMFKKFDKYNDGFISLQQFIQGLQKMFKSSLQERVGYLFQFYDVSKKNGVSFNEFKKMLLSYPQKQLNKMLTDKFFLNSLTDLQFKQYFSPEMKILDKYIIQEQSNRSNNLQQNKLNHDSDHMPSLQEYIKMQQKIQQMLSLKLKGQQATNKIKYQIQKQATIKNNNKIPLKKGGSALQFQKSKRKFKQLHIISSVSSLVNKYATFIFNEMKIDKVHGLMSKKQFSQVIKQHYQIIHTYSEGFHSYIWQTDQNDIPDFFKTTSWIEGECICQYKGQMLKRYVKFIKNTLIIFAKKKDVIPLEIKNLEGLVVSEKEVEKNNVKQKWIVIRHRDGIYPQKQYNFMNENNHKLWMKFLAQFQGRTIYQDYKDFVKIGEGSYSKVYKGYSNQTGKQCAIKVIQKYNLSLQQKQVLKFQCNILELCHHPNIVKFIKKYQTKSHNYIIMEYFPEGDLFNYVNNKVFLDEYQAAIVMKQLIDSFIYLNELGLVHRDLKPQNIMVVLNNEKNMINRVKILDFGLAVYKDNLKSLPEKQRYGGTPGFAAPEMFKKQDYDQTIDVFSLGVILYFMLSGYFPFHSLIPEQIFELTMSCNINFQTEHWKNISKQGKDLLLRMITFKQKRINFKQTLEHKWLTNIDNLKIYNSINKRVTKIHQL